MKERTERSGIGMEYSDVEGSHPNPTRREGQKFSLSRGRVPEKRVAGKPAEQIRRRQFTPTGLVMASLGTIPALLCGCGNQMFRQPSYAPLDTPRAAPPPDAVPVATGLMPFDAHPVISAAFGDRERIQADGGNEPSATDDPPLPPPNLSDDARNQPAPAVVNALANPLPNDPRVVHAGHVLFMNRCVQCHNPSGTGYGPVGGYLVPSPPDLASDLVQRNSDGAIFWHITLGQGKMPGFKHWTTPAERWSLVSFVRSLKNAPDISANAPAIAQETMIAKVAAAESSTGTRHAGGALSPESGPPLLGRRVLETFSAEGTAISLPYPPYGEEDFQSGVNRNPYKTLGKPASPAESLTVLSPYSPQPLPDGGE